ncbi:MAG: hypothetical protein HY236_06850 [Acidobacteria bacterium]|nr:hypothetical protein [Acidobacteriota bacterium]
MMAARRSSISLGFLCLLLGLSAFAGPAADDPPGRRASTAVSGPALGYGFDENLGALRPILGIPGASVLGGKLDVGVGFSVAEVSPRQDYALGIASGSKELLIVDLAAGRAVARSLSGVAPGADRVFLSSTGAAASLYYRNRRSAAIITGLPGAPQLSGDFDLSALPPLITAMAVSDDGRLLLAGVSEGAAAALFALRPGNSPRYVAAAGNVTSICFLENAHDALIADSRDHEILLLREVGEAWERVLLAGPKDGISSPVAVSASSDGRRVFAVNAGSGVIAALSLAGGAVALIPCRCSPSGLHRLNGNAVFRLTAFSEAPLFVLDGEQPEPRVVFVPSEIVTAPVGSPRPRHLPRERSRE